MNSSDDPVSQPTTEPDFDLIGRYCPDRSRPTNEPGGMECQQCGCIFIGAEWHARCRVCEETVSGK